MQSYPLLILMLLPLSGFALLLLKTHRDRARGSFAVILLCLILALTGLQFVSTEGPYILSVGPYEAPWGITLNIGTTEAVLAAVFLAIAAALSGHGLTSLEQEVPASRLVTYPTLFQLSLAAVLGILMTGDLFNSFVFLEVSSLSACGMTVVSRSKDRLFAALKYLILSSLGSGLVLMGIAYLYAMTGHLNLKHIHLALQPVLSDYPAMTLISLALFVTGLGLKSAIFPLHIWLPDAYEAAPTPSSAFFSALASKAPAILMIKLLFGVYGFAFLSGTAIAELLTLLGAAGMLTGSLLARKQQRLKRMIAYSSVAQMGYVFLGMGLASPLGITLALYHMVAHSLSKACIFLSVGTMLNHSGKTSLEDLRGIGREMPFTLGIFTLCGLSMVGIPMLPGFISKFNLSLAALQDRAPWVLAVILLSSLLNATYYFPVIINGYFGEDNLQGSAQTAEAGFSSKAAPVMALCLMMVLAGFLSGPLLSLMAEGFYAG